MFSKLVKIPRRLFIYFESDSDLSFRAFCDASQYAEYIYLRFKIDLMLNIISSSSLLSYKLPYSKA